MLELAAERGELPLLVLLDGVQDPQNLGTLLRTATAINAHGIILSKHRAAHITPAVEKASAGAVEYLLIAQVANLHQTIIWLKAQNIWVVGVEASGDQMYDEADLNRALALVLGSEAHGSSRIVRKSCDFLIRLPMAGPLNSLNVAVAGSIVLYEAWRQRARHLAKSGLSKTEMEKEGNGQVRGIDGWA
jgi:23S rRNA (guanosine2251-2'-O)-methyltransferase